MSVAQEAPGWDATVAEHRQRQLLRIGQTAADLITTHGLAGVSMSQLARAVGISRPTLYNYVPDVAAAVRVYLAAQTETFHAAIASALDEEAGPEAKLRRYIREQVAYVAGADHRVAAALHEAGIALGGTDTPAAHQERQSGLLDGILADGVRTGAFRAAVGDAQATLISRLLYCAHELIHQHHLTEDDAVAAITSLVFGGITSTGSQRAGGE